MAETTTPFKFDKVALKKHLEDVVENQNKYVGKHNHNPFIWIKANVTPLVNRLEKGEETKELSDAILQVSKTAVPIINPSLKEEVKEAPKKLAPTGNALT